MHEDTKECIAGDQKEIASVYITHCIIDRSVEANIMTILFCLTLTTARGSMVRKA